MTSASKHSPYRTPTLSAASRVGALEVGKAGEADAAVRGRGGPAGQAEREMTLQESCSQSLQANLSRDGWATGLGNIPAIPCCLLPPPPKVKHTYTHTQPLALRCLYLYKSIYPIILVPRCGLFGDHPLPPS